MRSRTKSGFRFAKMHGLGNDFMVADFVTQDTAPDPERIAAWGDRRHGIGFDQFLAVCVPDRPEADFRYRIFNADGSEAEQCGNGARCFARFVTANKLTVKRNLVLQTLAGDIRTELGSGGNVTVHLPAPHTCTPARVPVAGTELELTPVSTGNPHAVIFVDDVRKADVETVGAALQHHPMFPSRVNVGFLEVVDRGFARLRVFERGVGETLACGSGACAAMAAARLAGLIDPTARISLPGGKLQMAWPGPDAAVKMTGPATFVYEGRVKL